ncbi:hypothetical protein IT413_02185 [Candidatus Peregrinibacteria bacterium]|nr:hypothetical protein [Candidatus Peregrinibacteria bacterium]
MADVRKVIEEFSVKDLEDNSALNIMVESCSEIGNDSKPGIQVHFMGRIVTFEPLNVEPMVYKAKKAGLTEVLLENDSWMAYEDQYVKVSLVLGTPLKAKVEVKTRSSEPVVKTYDLPFTF